MGPAGPLTEGTGWRIAGHGLPGTLLGSIEGISYLVRVPLYLPTPTHTCPQPRRLSVTPPKAAPADAHVVVARSGSSPTLTRPPSCCHSASRPRWRRFVAPKPAASGRPNPRLRVGSPPQAHHPTLMGNRHRPHVKNSPECAHDGPLTAPSTRRRLQETPAVDRCARAMLSVPREAWLRLLTGAVCVGSHSCSSWVRGRCCRGFRPSSPAPTTAQMPSWRSCRRRMVRPSSPSAGAPAPGLLQPFPACRFVPRSERPNHMNVGRIPPHCARQLPSPYLPTRALSMSSLRQSRVRKRQEANFGVCLLAG